VAPHRAASGRRLGQHFLTARPSSGVWPKLPVPVPSAGGGIGPGRGALTEFLLARASRVVAIEIDPRLAESLRERFRNAPGLTVLQADVLETGLGQWGPAVIAATCPTTSPRRFWSGSSLSAPAPPAIVLTQKEVAERLAARPAAASTAT